MPLRSIAAGELHRSTTTEMAFQLTDVVPWGRSFDEYVAMFRLSDVDLRKTILGCADGPADFNAELTRRGGTVVSVDPLYDHTAEEIRHRIADTFEQVMAQTRNNSHEFVWQHVRSVDELGRIRMRAMQNFLSDYVRGKEESRYQTASLPSLAFEDDQFELALCSHFLFLYSDRFDLEFHVASIREMCRVAGEARVFPLLQLGSTPSPHVGAVTDHFQQAGYEVTVVQVPYEFQRGGNEMMRIRSVGQSGEPERLPYRQFGN